MKGTLLYSPIEMNEAFKKELTKLHWKESRVSYWVTKDEKLIRKTLAMPPDVQKQEIEAQGEIAIRSYNQTDFVKNRVAIEVQFGKYAFVTYDLFVKHLAFYVGNQIDLGIEVLPMKILQSQMSSGPSYYEGELYNVVRQGRGVPAVPLVIIRNSRRILHHTPSSYVLNPPFFLGLGLAFLLNFCYNYGV
ncbi:MAG: hypothetical protein LBS10_08900, partial [Gracilibacteraceae bacterium]|nr:hypothetical protein [Gracilibacteraceae bacterium]